jgi:hypothetical protein
MQPRLGSANSCNCLDTSLISFTMLNELTWNFTKMLHSCIDNTASNLILTIWSMTTQADLDFTPLPYFHVDLYAPLHVEHAYCASRVAHEPFTAAQPSVISFAVPSSASVRG